MQEKKRYYKKESDVIVFFLFFSIMISLKINLFFLISLILIIYIVVKRKSYIEVCQDSIITGNDLKLVDFIGRKKISIYTELDLNKVDQIIREFKLFSFEMIQKNNYSYCVLGESKKIDIFLPELRYEVDLIKKVINSVSQNCHIDNFVYNALDRDEKDNIYNKNFLYRNFNYILCIIFCVLFFVFLFYIKSKSQI